MAIKANTALCAFRSNLNCAQSVITAFLEDLHVDQETVINMSNGFGAGMGRLQETCGAVTGAYMVFGLYNALLYKDIAQRKEATYSMIQQFNQEFSQIHQTTHCRDLLKCDLRTDEGQNHFYDNNLGEKVCEKCIATSVSIVEKLLVRE
jgi:C_GCAxxG_C_C family probable redox protein